MEQAQALRPDDNSMLSFDLDPEQWLDDPDDDEEERVDVPAAAAAAPPRVRHFADIGRLPAPDGPALPRTTAAKAVDHADRDGKQRGASGNTTDGDASDEEAGEIKLPSPGREPRSSRSSRSHLRPDEPVSGRRRGASPVPRKTCPGQRVPPIDRRGSAVKAKEADADIQHRQHRDYRPVRLEPRRCAAPPAAFVSLSRPRHSSPAPPAAAEQQHGGKHASSERHGERTPIQWRDRSPVREGASEVVGATSPPAARRDRGLPSPGRRHDARVSPSRAPETGAMLPGSRSGRDRSRQEPLPQREPGTSTDDSRRRAQPRDGREQSTVQQQCSASIDGRAGRAQPRGRHSNSSTREQQQKSPRQLRSVSPARRRSRVSPDPRASRYGPQLNRTLPEPWTRHDSSTMQQQRSSPTRRAAEQGQRQRLPDRRHSSPERQRKQSPAHRRRHPSPERHISSAQRSRERSPVQQQSRHTADDRPRGSETAMSRTSHGRSDRSPPASRRSRASAGAEAFPDAHARRRQSEPGSGVTDEDNRRHADGKRTDPRRERPREHYGSEKQGTESLPPPLSLPPPPPLLSQPPYDPELDFLSGSFDPLRALYTTFPLMLPNPAALPLDNLHKCRGILPADDPEWRHRNPRTQRMLEDAAAARRAADPARAAAKAAMDRQRAARKEAQEGPSALDRIAGAAGVGPLAALKRAYDAGGRVRVVTRHARGVRGHATGTLVAFDRFLNLVLRDVEEDYTVLLRVKRVLPARGDAAPTPVHAEQDSEPPGLVIAAAAAAGAGHADAPMPSPDEGGNCAERMPAEAAACGSDEGLASQLGHADVQTPLYSTVSGTTESPLQEPTRTAYPYMDSQSAEEEEQLLVFRSDWRPQQLGAETFASPGKGSERSLASALTDSNAGRPSPVPPGSVQSLASALTDSDSEEAPGKPAAGGGAALESTEAGDASADAAQHADAALLYAESFRARAAAAQPSGREADRTASEQGPGADADAAGAIRQPGCAANVGGGAGRHVDQSLANGPVGLESSAKSSGERVRWVRKQDHRRRKLRQVFVRGDSVVLVSLVERPAASHPLPATD